ncbi:MAG: DUF5683 domain-containing protein [Tannerella sp.]|jgi:hypothetical protein|nr:DUF5683 domain-containing protein [Tannerella sp.]
MGKGRKLKYLRIIIGTVCLLPTGIAGTVYARDTILELTGLPNDTVLQPDSPAEIQSLTDSIIREASLLTDDTVIISNDRIDSLTVLLPKDSARIAVMSPKNGGYIAIKDVTAFKPNPKTAYLIATIFPGFGQAYNRQYWKLPIVYGGLVGFMYAITWNNKVYQDYKKAYFDMRIDYNNYRADPERYGPETWSASWQDFTNDPLNFMTNQNNHTRLQKGRDYFRRYRDLSIILSVVFYAICIADAYVDAQMFDFDISPDLSFRVAPEFYPSTLANSRSFGLNICMTF